MELFGIFETAEAYFGRSKIPTEIPGIGTDG